MTSGIAATEMISDRKTAISHFHDGHHKNMIVKKKHLHGL